MYTEVFMQFPHMNLDLPRTILGEAFSPERQRGWDGLKYGIFYVDGESSFLVGYPRFSDCKDFGCDDKGWDTASHRRDGL